jgi:hypothetical protein
MSCSISRLVTSDSAGASVVAAAMDMNDAAVYGDCIDTDT